MEHHNESINLDEKFVFPDKVKKFCYALMGLGVIALIYGFIAYHGEHSHRFWANILLNNVFFLLISLGGLFFVCANYVGKSGWYSIIKRIPEALSAYLPIGALLMLTTLIGLHEIYHWSHEGITDPASPNYDEVIAGKSAFLNVPFFATRMIVFLGLWVMFGYMMRKFSVKEDLEGGLKWHIKMNRFSSIFLIVFAISTSVVAWDWVMSIDTHWYSTLFGWYTFASLWVSASAAITLLIIYLKRNGYLQVVNENHIHDLGKFVFAFTVLWTYLWVAQFLLMWYANIPEETIYFTKRWDNYMFLWAVNPILNFFLPFLVLMTRPAKRNLGTLTFVCTMVLIGHWIDFFQMIMPGMVGEHWGIGLMEIGLTAGYFGLFIFTIFNALTKAALIPKNHPFLKESMQHHI